MARLPRLGYSVRPCPEIYYAPRTRMSRNVPKSDFGTLRDIFGIFEKSDAPIFLRSSETIEKNPFENSVEPECSRKFVFSKNLKCPEMSRNPGQSGVAVQDFGTFRDIPRHFGTLSTVDFGTRPSCSAERGEGTRSFPEHLGSRENSPASRSYVGNSARG